MAESLRQKILEYEKLSAPEQRDMFVELYNSVSSQEVAKYYLLLLVMSTKYEIFIGHGDHNNKNNENIKTLITTFKKVIRILNKVEFNEVGNFIEYIGNSERRLLNDYVVGVAKNILLYCQDSKTTLSGDHWVAMDSFVRTCGESLLNDLNLIEGIYSDYKKTPRRDSASAYLEAKKLAFERRAIKYKLERLFCLILILVVAACLLYWGIFLVTDPLDLYRDDTAKINYYVLASSTLGKIVVTTTLFFILTACLRVYFALSHNETICQHRADVLACYDALYSTTEEKELVVAKVADALFTQLPTGFSKLQSDEGKSGVSIESLVSLLTRQGSSSAS